MASGLLLLAALLAHSVRRASGFASGSAGAHRRQPQLALAPGCGSECAGLGPRGGRLDVVRAGIRCSRGDGLSGGMLICRTVRGGASPASPGVGDAEESTFVVDPEDDEQMRHVVSDGQLESDVDAWLSQLDGDGERGEAAVEEPEEGQDAADDAEGPPQVAWLRECGCTGLHNEATHLVAPLAGLLAQAAEQSNRTEFSRAELRRRIFTNSCPESHCGHSPAVQAAIDAVAVPVGSFWRMVELTLRRCGADIAQLRAYDRLNASAKHHWGCTNSPGAVALQLVVHVGPEPGGGGPCAWPEAARWLRSAPNVVAISRTMFEVDGMPAEATARCNEYDEVWVPASFNIET